MQSNAKLECLRLLENQDYLTDSEHKTSSCQLGLLVGDLIHRQRLFATSNSSLLRTVETLYGEKLVEDNLPQLICRPCVRRLKNIATFIELIKLTFALQQLQYIFVVLTFLYMINNMHEVYYILFFYAILFALQRILYYALVFLFLNLQNNFIYPNSDVSNNINN